MPIADRRFAPVTWVPRSQQSPGLGIIFLSYPVAFVKVLWELNPKGHTEILGPPFCFEDVVQRPIEATNGWVELPQAPGIGILIDGKKVARFRCRY